MSVEVLTWREEPINLLLEVVSYGFDHNCWEAGIVEFIEADDIIMRVNMHSPVLICWYVTLGGLSLIFISMDSASTIFILRVVHLIKFIIISLTRARIHYGKDYSPRAELCRYQT